MNYAVSHGFDLRHVGDNADLWIGQRVDNDTHRFRVSGYLHILLCTGALYEVFVIEHAHFFAYTLAYALGFYGIIRGVKKLIFKRAGAGVYD